MRGLICKDFFVMKKQLGYYLAFFVVYGVLAVTPLPFSPLWWRSSP